MDGTTKNKQDKNICAQQLKSPFLFLLKGGFVILNKKLMPIPSKVVCYTSQVPNSTHIILLGMLHRFLLEN